MHKPPGARRKNEDDLVGVPGRTKLDSHASCARVRDLKNNMRSESDKPGPCGAPDALILRRSLLTKMDKHPGARPTNEDGVPGRTKVDRHASCARVRRSKNAANQYPTMVTESGTSSTVPGI